MATIKQSFTLFCQAVHFIGNSINQFFTFRLFFSSQPMGVGLRKEAFSVLL